MEGERKQLVSLT